MKRVMIAVIVACLPVMVGANDLSAVFTDSATASDSNTIRHDTVWSDSWKFDNCRYLQFASRLRPFESYDDTNWTNDTFFINFQSSFNDSAWTTHAIDTLVDNTTSNSTVILDADATVFGNFGRLMMVHRDSIGTGEADSALMHRGTPFKKLIELFVVER